jgi:hypothetical protein
MVQFLITHIKLKCILVTIRENDWQYEKNCQCNKYCLLQAKGAKDQLFKQHYQILELPFYTFEHTHTELKGVTELQSYTAAIKLKTGVGHLVD